MRRCLAVCLILTGARLDACDCKPPPPPRMALEGAAAVFLAEVTAVETAGESRTVTLKVERWWKGGEGVEVTVSTAKSSATCGYGFEQGKKYLVYAGRKEKALRVSLCSRTRPAAQADKDGDFKELGEGKLPTTKAERPANEGGPSKASKAGTLVQTAPPAIEGDWVSVSTETDGKPVAREKLFELKVVIGVGRLEYVYVGKPQPNLVYRLDLDPTTDPKQFTLTQVGSLKSPAVPGIYELDGDNLRLCFADGPGRERRRPKEFATAPGTRQVLVSLKRAERPE